jgi:dienelactone hydrolase
MSFKSCKYKHLFVCVVFLLLTSPLFAQLTAQISPAGTGYLQYLPDDYASSNKKHPVIIYLHGMGERGNGREPEIWRAGVHGPIKLIKEGHNMSFKSQGKNYSYIVIAPQLSKSQGSWPSTYVNEVLEYVSQTLRIDSERVYMTGLSLGGGGTWLFAMDYPEKVAAIAPVCGAQFVNGKACRIAHHRIPVWAFHGDADKTVLPSVSQKWVDFLNGQCSVKIEPAAKLTIYPGVGHNSWSRAYTPDNSLHKPNVFEWFLLYTNNREVVPMAPMVDAGSNISIRLPQNSVKLNGTRSKDIEGGLLTYQWRKVNGPEEFEISGEDTPTPLIEGLQSGTYEFELLITNERGVSSAARTKVFVHKPDAKNTSMRPVANAKSDIIIQYPESKATLDAAGSYHPNGRIVSYQWIKESGLSGETYSNLNSAKVSVTGLKPGTYRYQLVLTDEKGNTASQNVRIVVNKAPVAQVDGDRTITLPVNSVILDGSTSYDPEGKALSYRWEQIGGSANIVMGNNSDRKLMLGNLQRGFYVFQLTVTDIYKAQDFVQVRINVNPSGTHTPLLSVQESYLINYPENQLTLENLPNAPEQSQSEQYVWQRIKGHKEKMKGLHSNKLHLSELSPGTYLYRLIATSGEGASHSRLVRVVVNKAPSAVIICPVPQPIAASVLMLDGTFSSDEDGSIISYKWEKVRGSDQCKILNTNTAQVTLVNLSPGEYTLRLTVTDNSRSQSSADFTFQVKPTAASQMLEALK